MGVGVGVGKFCKALLEENKSYSLSFRATVHTHTQFMHVIHISLIHSLKPCPSGHLLFTTSLGEVESSHSHCCPPMSVSRTGKSLPVEAQAVAGWFPIPVSSVTTDSQWLMTQLLSQAVSCPGCW